MTATIEEFEQKYGSKEKQDWVDKNSNLNPGFDQQEL